MEHLLLKATTITAVEEGHFEAVISTASPDRDGDIVEPSALVDALAKWAKIGKLVPLAYSHRDPETGHAVVVGHIDPASARADGSRVITKGWVDQSTERGADTWRLVKSGTLSFSYGYLVPDGGATKRRGKKTGLHITKMDLFEISVVPVGPANNETLVLSWKSDEALREEATRVAREIEVENLPSVSSASPAELEPSTADLMQELKEVKDRLATAEEALKAPPRTVEEQRREATRVLRETEEEQIPKVPEPPEAPTEPEIDLAKELQEVKARLAKSEESLEDLRKKAEATDKETRSRSVDPLRAQADAVALAEASGGESLRKPPRKVTPKPPELLPLGDLKQRMRDEMLARLSEGIPE